MTVTVFIDDCKSVAHFGESRMLAVARRKEFARLRQKYSLSWFHAGNSVTAHAP